MSTEIKSPNFHRWGMSLRISGAGGNPFIDMLKYGDSKGYLNVPRSDFLAAVEAECHVRLVPADAIVIDRSELPKVIVDRDWIEVDGQTFAQERGTDGLQRVILRYVSAIEYLTTHPPTPPVDEADVEALAGLIRHDDTNGRSASDIARRLLATGKVTVTR